MDEIILQTCVTFHFRVVFRVGSFASTKNVKARHSLISKKEKKILGGMTFKAMILLNVQLVAHYLSLFLLSLLNFLSPLSFF